MPTPDKTIANVTGYDMCVGNCTVLSISFIILMTLKFTPVQKSPIFVHSMHFGNSNHQP